MSRPFRGSIAVAAGLLSEKQLRSPTWRQLYRDVYVRSDVELTHDLWCRAAGLVLPATAVIGGASAAHVHGADVAGRGAPVEVVSSEHMRRRAHMVVLRASLGDGDVANVCGLRVTSPVRTAFDLARGRPLDEAVVAIDALLVRRLVSLADIAAYADAGHRSWRGVHRLPDVLALAAGGAESPMETRLRLRLVQAGLPAPALQHRVYDERAASSRGWTWHTSPNAWASSTMGSATSTRDRCARTCAGRTRSAPRAGASSASRRRTSSGIPSASSPRCAPRSRANRDVSAPPEVSRGR